MRHLLKKLKSNREFKVLIFNLLLIIPVVYAGQIYLAYKEYNRELPISLYGPERGTSNPTFRVLLFSLLNRLELNINSI